MNNRQIIIEPNMEVFSKLGVKSIEIKNILLNTRIKRITFNCAVSSMDCIDDIDIIYKDILSKFGRELDIEFITDNKNLSLQFISGTNLIDEAIDIAKKSDAVLLGAVGGNVGNSRWYDVAPNLRPEAGLLKIRKELGLFANLRPAVLYEELSEACPLKNEIKKDGFDMVIVRELTGGLYFGDRYTKEIDGVKTAVDTLVYNENEIRRVARVAFDIASKRRKKVISVDKANVLDSSRLWRDVVEEVAKEYKDIAIEHMLVDNAAMQLVMNPGQFDVVLTENMFGDILSDEASMITGSIGMLPSAGLNESKLGLYEPSHGSAPDIAGKNIANPIATILSASMLLRYSLGLDKEADIIDKAVEKVLKDGFRTVDIYTEGMKKLSTTQMGDKIVEYIK
mgnify:CR=1 FL=1